jgi:beta-phosphoglucomutase family hydrolase/RpiB/LacA/LacB family sugar-phosphate isomerase
MRVVIGTDDAGFFLKQNLSAYLRELGHEVLDVGTYSGDGAADYPDYAQKLGKALIEGRADRGVLICRSGVGASVAANKLPGIRAGLCHDTYSAHQGVENDDMNVLVLGCRVIGRDLARELVRTYLGATFTGEERHHRPLQRVRTLERRPARDEQHPLSRENYDAVLFDLDGVITDTANIHAACGRTMFDEYLRKRAIQLREPFRAFDVVTDYKLHVIGKSLHEAVRDFLESRGIVLPEGGPDDPPTSETICGLGNRKSELMNDVLAAKGAEAYPGSVAFLSYLRHLHIKSAVVTSSHNCQAVLKSANVSHLFDVRVDADVIAAEGLAGKPAPDSFLKAAAMLGVSPDRAVIVEDAVSGIKAGVRGGFGLVIGVARKVHPEELKAHGAHIVVRDVAELLTEPVCRR